MNQCTKPDEAPTPWKIELDYSLWIYDAEDNLVEIVSKSDINIKLWNYIVHCVNTRAALVEALEYARDWLDALLHHKEIPIPIMAMHIDNGLTPIDEALAAAKGEKDGN